MDSQLSKSGLIYSPEVLIHNIFEIKLKNPTSVIQMGCVFMVKVI